MMHLSADQSMRLSALFKHSNTLTLMVRFALPTGNLALTPSSLIKTLKKLTSQRPLKEETSDKRY